VVQLITITYTNICTTAAELKLIFTAWTGSYWFNVVGGDFIVLASTGETCYICSLNSHRVKNYGW
jgi:hypothetical protein